MKWQPPDHWLKISTIDAHTAGEPLRVITGGFPDIPGNSMLEKRRYARQHHDQLRRALMWEPRGHADMYGCILTPPVTPDGHVGVLFLHNEGYSTMCGHGIIGLVKVGIDCGLIHPHGAALRIDTPAGRITAMAAFVENCVKEVSFDNVPSFLLERDLAVEVPELGKIVCDVAFGGAFYAYVDSAAAGIDIEPGQYSKIIDLGMRIKSAVNSNYRIVHPAGDEDLNFLYGTIFHQSDETVHSRNVCVFADGEVDRSPTGTGVSGRAAILSALGDLEPNTKITIESIIGTRFDVEVVGKTKVGTVQAVIPRVTGTAHITGRHQFLVDPDDPLRSGFFLR